MKNQLPILTFLLLICFQQILIAQCPDNLLDNGDMEGVLGENSLAFDWSTDPYYGSTPDLNDASGQLNTSPGYNWIGTILASSNDGSWQNLFQNESIYQNVILEIGAEYSLCFEFASQGIESSGILFDDPIGVIFYLNNTLAYSTPLDTTPYSWETSCYIFTATQAFNNILFTTDVYAYVGIDGVCLSKNNSSSTKSQKIIQSSVYPNPVMRNAALTFDIPDDMSFDLTIMNSLGETVCFASNLTNGALNLSDYKLSCGLHFFKINSGLNQNVFVGKFLIL